LPRASHVTQKQPPPVIELRAKILLHTPKIKAPGLITAIERREIVFQSAALRLSLGYGDDDRGEVAATSQGLGEPTERRPPRAPWA